MKLQLAAILIGALAFNAVAQNTNTTSKPAAESKPTEQNLDELRKKVSYAVGMNIGQNWKRQNVDFDTDEVKQGIKDTLAGKSPKLSETEAREAITQWQAHLRSQEEKRGEENVKKAEEFLAQNEKKAGVKKTASGLQYEIITEGSGKSPSPKDTVSVHYRGTLIDGTEFDSSHKRGQPAEFRVDGVIKGWTEALQMMKPGAKWKLYIPPAIAYGKQSPPGIPSNSLLIFDVELLSVKPAPEESVKAVSGEIIKVPSAEELKKGAKIEVLKEEDVKKLQEQQKTNAPAKPEKK